jgi:hypothetical protein
MVIDPSPLGGSRAGLEWAVCVDQVMNGGPEVWVNDKVAAVWKVSAHARCAELPGALH